MKALIPVAGAGTTLRPHTHTQPKPLIPVAGKPILGHIIDSLLEVGVRDFVFVIGYLGEKIKDFVEEYAATHDFQYTFVQQEPRLGLAHAVHVCREVLPPEEPVLIILGDTIIETDFEAILQEPYSVLAVQKVEEPWNFGIAVPNDDGLVDSLVEKPTIPKSNQALVGLYKVLETGQLLAAVDHLIQQDIRTRGEFQLTDALMHMIDQGVKMRTHQVRNWHDCGKKDVLLETNRILLKRMHHLKLPEFESAILVPPVYIAANCTIEHSIVGPYVAVAEHATLRNAIVQDAILGAYSSLNDIMLKESVVGNDTALTGRWHAINIGDNTEIDFNS
jgi:glucose-1-phosphate thymidylyltransferase